MCQDWLMDIVLTLIYVQPVSLASVQELLHKHQPAFQDEGSVIKMRVTVQPSSSSTSQATILQGEGGPTCTETKGLADCAIIKN